MTDQTPEPSADMLAEMAVLGSAMQSSAAAGEMLAALSVEHFRYGPHRIIFGAVERLTEASAAVEPMSVMTELARAGMLGKVGGPELGSGAAYLHSLMQRAGSVDYHAPIVRAGFLQHNAEATLESCLDIARRGEFDPDVHLEQIRTMVEAATVFGGSSPLRPNSESVTEVLDGLETAADPGLPTGYPDLDDAIGGLRDGELIVVGGLPGNGKSLIGLCVADHVATELGLPVLFSSLEMTEAQLTQRRIAATAKVPLVNIVRHCVTDREWDLIRRAQADLMNTSLFVDETTSASLVHIRRQLHTMKRTGTRARLLVIDYLGFMKAATSESRQQAVAELARGAKNIAREFMIPVILLAQLNRGPDSRSDKRPELADLRESGEIEQSADIVILLHREDYYERESPRAGEIDLIVRKNRQGPQCTVTLAFQGHYGRIVSMSAGWSASAHASAA